MGKHIKTIIAVVLFVGSCMSAAWYLDVRYSRAEDTESLQQSVQLLNKRLDNYIVTDQLFTINEKIEKMEDKFQTCDPLQIPAEYRVRYRELLRQRKELEQRLQK